MMPNKPDGRIATAQRVVFEMLRNERDLFIVATWRDAVRLIKERLDARNTAPDQYPSDATIKTQVFVFQSAARNGLL